MLTLRFRWARYQLDALSKLKDRRSVTPNNYHSFAKSSRSGAKSTRSPYYLGVQPSASRFFTEVRGKQEYTLAVLLLEIALQKSLENITAQEASLGSTYDTLDSHLQLLHEKSQKAQSRMGQKYGDAIRDCIKLASLGTDNLPGVAAPVSDDQKQQILWERCCQPLQCLARAGFAKAHGFNVVPSTDLEWGEEDNVFGFFTAGISAHESTDRGESSEVTLVEFAALLDGGGPNGPDLEIKEARKRTALSNRTHRAPPSADGVFYGAFQSRYFGRAGLSRVLEPWNYPGNTA